MITATHSLEEKCDTAASRYYRRLTPYCEPYATKPHVCWGPLDMMHIKSRRNRRLRYEPENNIIGCRAIHTYYTDNPREWELFVKSRYPQKWAFVEEHQNETVRANDAFYEDWIKFFREN